MNGGGGGGDGSCLFEDLVGIYKLTDCHFVVPAH